MKTSLSWLRAYVPELDVSVQVFTDAMTLSGTKVEDCVLLDENLDQIVIGQIDKIEKHPDADKLLICQVNVGSEVVQIVTGAPNVNTGDKVPIVLAGGNVAAARDGVKEPGGMKIKKGKLRGIESTGMMCSIEELGSTREMYPEAPADGIYIFPADVEIGVDAVEALGLRDAVFEFEVTSNRVDCYSVLGLAREAAATFQKPYRPVVVSDTGNDEDVNDYLKVTVENTTLCPRFCAKVIKNIKIAPSPKWLQRRLASVGIRPINNIVDITNYVMEEYGQPMHAYNLEKIGGRHIIVKTAQNGDTFTTLDGKERNLDENVLMICDENKPIGIAGIMGGENTMVTEDMEIMALEVATFDGVNIRKSSKKVGLRTDASGKFEKGLDPHNAKLALNRACQLIEEFGAGEVIGGTIDVAEPLKEPLRVKFDHKKINGILGTDLSQETMLEYFARIELDFDAATNEVTVPTFRQDIERLADLAEEVARFYGYDKIPTTLPQGEATIGKLAFKMRVEQVARNVAEHAGFSEGMSYSFESPKVFDQLLLDANASLRQSIEILNPLGEDYSIMRTSTLHGMFTSLGTNAKRRNKDVRLYELGNVYLARELPLQELPDERTQLTLGFYGTGDFFTMKGVVKAFLEKLGMFEKENYCIDDKKPYLHPGRQADIYYQDKLLGYLGQVHPTVAESYGLNEATYVAVLDLNTILDFATFDRKYQGIAKYPAVTRDISMTIAKEVSAGQIEEVISQKGGLYLESYVLFDVYEGAQIEAGLKSVAYSIVFRAKDKTLEEAEISAAMEKVIKGLEAIGAKLRK
ncbi:MAG: phenylalanine--tRNA ligase subunit beta [Lachnospiraceae bacterium]|nr:phenylalanine--tRNA ligase subunit beta [Lachnospiraceae bacterium]